MGIFWKITESFSYLSRNLHVDITVFCILHSNRSVHFDGTSIQTSDTDNYKTNNSLDWVTMDYGHLPHGRKLILGSSKIYHTAFETLCIIIPLLSSMIYGIIYISLRKKGRIIGQQNHSHTQVLIQKKFLKTIIIVVLIQTLTLVPASVYHLIDDISGDLTFSQIVLSQIYSFNFAINPFLYIRRLKNYRETFRTIYCKKFC